MPYINRRLVQRPYQPIAYIQRGGGLSAFFDGVRNTIFPWLTSFGKTAASALSQASKSKAARRLKRKAQDVISKTLTDAGGRILQGENVGQVIKDSADQTNTGVTKAFKDVAFDQGTELRNSTKKPRLSPTAPKAKRPAKPRKKTAAKASQPGRSSKRTTKDGFTLI